MSCRIIQGDCREILAAMESESVQCVVTSPPYWGLRDYKLPPLVWSPTKDRNCQHHWGGPMVRCQSAGDHGIAPEYNEERKCAVAWHLCELCGAWRGSLGLEPTPELYVEHIVEVFREARRVLRTDGTLWLNMGDCYAGSGKAGSNPEYQAHHTEFGRPSLHKERFGVPAIVPPGAKPKDLLGMPWRVAFALQADGWWLRRDIIWSKPNPMPESVTDRPTSAHEYVFLLTKSARYYYDADAIREPHAEKSFSVHTTPRKAEGTESKGERFNKWLEDGPGRQLHAGGRNKRSVWQIATQPFPEAHFATFPEKLVEPCILAGTSPEACGICGAPSQRLTRVSQQVLGQMTHSRRSDALRDANTRTDLPLAKTRPRVETIGWRPACEHGNGTGRCVVLDPFAGSGTVGVVCKRLGRDFVGIELSEEYCKMARKRLTKPVTQEMFA